MTPDDHDRFARWAASYTLGALDTDDRRAFEAHVATCSICAAELAEIAALPGLIAKTGPADLERRPDPGRAAAITDAARAEMRDVRRRSLRWQLTAGALAAAAAVLVVLLAVNLGTGRDEAPAARAATVVMTSAVATEVAVSPRAWGTEITLDITGLPARPRYHLWTIDKDGEWVSAATWSPTPNGAVRLTGATSTPTAQLGRIVISSNQRHDLLLEATL